MAFPSTRINHLQNAPIPHSISPPLLHPHAFSRCKSPRILNPLQFHSISHITTTDNAPVTKLLIILSTILTSLHILLFSILHTPLLTYPLSLYPTLYAKPYMVYRLLTGAWTYYTLGEYFFATLLLYLIGRQMERMWGSLKMLVFCVVVTLLGVPVQLLLALGTAMWSGLYLVVFALLVQYWMDVPAVVRIKLFGKFSVNEKWALYMMALQLFFANFWSSSVVGVLGILLGLIWRIPIMKRLHRLVPQRVVNFFRKHVYPVLNPPPMRQRRRRAAAGGVRAASPAADAAPAAGDATQPQVRNLMAEDARAQQIDTNALFEQMLQNFARGRQAQAPAAQQPAAPAQANETLLASLEEMGFEREAAREALISSGNDVNQAVNILSS